MFPKLFSLSSLISRFSRHRASLVPSNCVPGSCHCEKVLSAENLGTAVQTQTTQAEALAAIQAGGEGKQGLLLGSAADGIVSDIDTDHITSAIQLPITTTAACSDAPVAQDNITLESQARGGGLVIHLAKDPTSNPIETLSLTVCGSPCGTDQGSVHSEQPQSVSEILDTATFAVEVTAVATTAAAAGDKGTVALVADGDADIVFVDGAAHESQSSLSRQQSKLNKTASEFEDCDLGGIPDAPVSCITTQRPARRSVDDDFFMQVVARGSVKTPSLASLAGSDASQSAIAHKDDDYWAQFLAAAARGGVAVSPPARGGVEPWQSWIGPVFAWSKPGFGQQLSVFPNPTRQAGGGAEGSL